MDDDAVGGSVEPDGVAIGRRCARYGVELVGSVHELGRARPARGNVDDRATDRAWLLKVSDGVAVRRRSAGDAVEADGALDRHRPAEAEASAGEAAIPIGTKPAMITVAVSTATGHCSSAVSEHGSPSRDCRAQVSPDQSPRWTLAGGGPPLTPSRPRPPAGPRGGALVRVLAPASPLPVLAAPSRVFRPPSRPWPLSPPTTGDTRKNRPPRTGGKRGEPARTVRHAGGVGGRRGERERRDRRRSRSRFTRHWQETGLDRSRSLRSRRHCQEARSAGRRSSTR